MNRLNVNDPLFGLTREQWVLVVMLLVSIIGLGLRILGFWSWDLSIGDEQATYRDAINNPGKRGLFSGYYHLTSYCIGLFDDYPLLAARLPAVVFGILVLPVFYGLVRHLSGTNVAIFSILALSVSSWHVEISQYVRYHAAVFLMAAMHICLFALFLKKGEWWRIAVSFACGGVAALLHVPAGIVFIPTGILCLLALANPSFLGLQDSVRSIIKVILLVGLAIGAIAFFVVYDVVTNWLQLSSQNPYRNNWALVPLLAFNTFGLPFFIAVGFGVVALFLYDRIVGTYAGIGILVSLVGLVVLANFINMSINYMTALFPFYFLSVGALCGYCYERLKPHSIIVAISIAAVIGVAQVPKLASYFLQRINVSNTIALDYVAEHAGEDAVYIGNVGSSFGNAPKLRRIALPIGPMDRRFAWQDYLDDANRSSADLWFVWGTSREGLAPELNAWLNENAVLKHEQRANRLDRKVYEITVWRAKSR